MKYNSLGFDFVQNLSLLSVMLSQNIKILISKEQRFLLGIQRCDVDNFVVSVWGGGMHKFGQNSKRSSQCFSDDPSGPLYQWTAVACAYSKKRFLLDLEFQNTDILYDTAKHIYKGMATYLVHTS